MSGSGSDFIDGGEGIALVPAHEGVAVVRCGRAGGHRPRGDDRLALGRQADQRRCADPVDRDLEAEAGGGEEADRLAGGDEPRREQAVAVIEEIVERLEVPIEGGVEAGGGRRRRVEVQPQALAARLAEIGIRLPVLNDARHQRRLARFGGIDQRPGRGALQQAVGAHAFVEEEGDRGEIERRLLRGLQDQGQPAFVVQPGAEQAVADRISPRLVGVGGGRGGGAVEVGDSELGRFVPDHRPERFGRRLRGQPIRVRKEPESSTHQPCLRLNKTPHNLQAEK